MTQKFFDTPAVQFLVTTPIYLVLILFSCFHVLCVKILRFVYFIK